MTDQHDNISTEGKDDNRLVVCESDEPSEQDTTNNPLSYSKPVTGDSQTTAPITAPTALQVEVLTPQGLPMAVTVLKTKNKEPVSNAPMKGQMISLLKPLDNSGKYPFLSTLPKPDVSANLCSKCGNIKVRVPGKIRGQCSKCKHTLCLAEECNSEFKYLDSYRAHERKHFDKADPNLCFHCGGTKIRGSWWKAMECPLCHVRWCGIDNCKAEFETDSRLQTHQTMAHQQSNEIADFVALKYKSPVKFH